MGTTERALNMVWHSEVLLLKVISFLMNWQAQQAQVRLAESGRITVVVQDNGSLHTSK